MFGQPRFSKRAIWKAVRRFVALANDASGAAMVEFTLFGPLLVAMAIYTMDYGLITFNRMEVQNAAQAGAQYAVVNNTYDSTAISTAVTGATKFMGGVTATSSQFCGCPSTTVVTYCSASCDTCNTATCSASVQGHYVTVTATPTTTYTPFIRYGLSSNSYTVSATSTVRIR